ncbi:UNVERIFIED_CONTAM: protein NRT1/ PTR FAMILY 5.5 [Sesamum radiatum]|uniref:Protein NRT1/ PTR FAMILY 5.5 n=1 Tax=Sesamum radiatum TaxID=300843 RepID=A0AAW2N9S8_SESRA
MAFVLSAFSSLSPNCSNANDLYALFSFVSLDAAVLWADILAGYALWMLMIYLTDVWKLKLTHAAGIVNVFLGLVGVIPFVLQFIVDSFLGNFWILLASSLSYCAGMGILTMSTPPVLADTLHTCNAYAPECISNAHRMLFFAAVVLIAVGISGHSVCLGSFLVEQSVELGLVEFSGRSLLTMFAGNWPTFVFTIIVAFALPYIKPWSLRFGIPAIFMVLATLVFLSRSCSYSRDRPEGSPLTLLLKVLSAAAFKLFVPRPPTLSQYHGVAEYSVLVQEIPPLRCCRCLEKAAIILPNQTLEQQVQNQWKLSTLTQVRNAQYIIFMIPLAMAFALWGLISSLSYTYFVEQAKTMNRKVGSLTVPITILLWFWAQGRRLFPRLLCSLWYVPIAGIATSMILGVVCCITAGSVESRRLNMVRKHDFLHKPDAEVPMSVFWLVPQFVLLGAVDGLLEFCTAAILMNKFVFSWWKFMLNFINLVHGFGCFGSVLIVYIAGGVSDGEGHSGWFQDSLNESRIDKYYWMLAWLIACNVVPYWMLTCWYSHMNQKEQIDPGETQPFCCCCC